MAHMTHLRGLNRSFDAVIGAAWAKTAIFIFLAPLTGTARGFQPRNYALRRYLSHRTALREDKPDPVSLLLPVAQFCAYLLVH